MHYCIYCNYMHLAELYGIVPLIQLITSANLPDFAVNQRNSDSLINGTFSELSRDLAEISWFSENPYTSINIELIFIGGEVSGNFTLL